MDAIRVTALQKAYGPIRALQGIDFSISGGEVVGLLGPNGAGKSTAMKILTGFLSPSAGQVSIFGKDLLVDPIAVKKHIGYLPESAPLYSEMQVGDYLQFIAQVRGLGSAQRSRAIDRVLERCDLLDRRHQLIGTLSKGLRQRTGLAQALLHEPDVLILDEPTSGLDPNQIQEIRTLIREIGKKRTVLLSTHILSEVQASCDRVIIINQGKIVADGPTQDVTRIGQKEALYTLLGAEKVRLSSEEILTGIQNIEGVLEVEKGFGAELQDNEHLMIIRAEKDVRREVAQWAYDHGLLVLEQRREQRKLEEVFRSLTS